MNALQCAGCVAAGALLLAGCGTTPAAKFYTLTAAPAPAAAGAPAGKMVGVGPVTLPEYLDRPQIVSRASANRLVLADTHRWAEPLADGVTRVLSENLAALLKSERIVAYPWRRSQAVAFQVKVELLQLDAGADGTLSLAARWSVLGPEGVELVPARRSSVSVPAAAGDYDAIVAAHGAALARLAGDIAAALTPLLARP